MREFAAQRGAELALTTHRRHASELAAEAVAAGYELVVAVGGDGTLNEVAAPLVGTTTTLGLVPCGSGDGLGRNLGIHGSLSHALEILRTGVPRVIDTGLAAGHPFFTVAGLGFEADVAERFNRLHRRGFIRYLRTSIAALRAHRSQPCTIEHAGGRVRLPVFTLAVANSDQYGNNAFIAPGAAIDDGLINLTAVPPLNFLTALPRAARLFSGTLANAKSILQLAGARFVVERDAPGLLHTDGETHPVGPRIEFSVRPSSLRILCPASA